MVEERFSKLPKEPTVRERPEIPPIEAAALVGYEPPEPAWTIAEGITPPEIEPTTLEALYPEMFLPEASEGISAEDLPGVILENLRTWAVEEPETFLSDLYERTTPEQAQAFMESMGLILEAPPIEETITTLFPDKTMEEFSAFVEEDWEGFVKVMQTSELIAEKETLLKTMGFSDEEIDDFLLITTSVTGWQAVWNKLRESTARFWFQTKDYLFTILPQAMFPDVKVGQSKVVGMPDKLAQEKGLAYTAEEVLQTNLTQREMRDKFRKLSVGNREQYEEWVKGHPELKPPPEWEGEILTLLKDNPMLILDPAFIGYVAADSAAFMAAFWGATAVVGLATKSPIAGMSAGVAVTTPAQSQDLYEDLLWAGATEEQASEIAVPMGLLISSVEILGGLAVLRAVGAMPGLRPFYQLFRRNLQREVAKGILSTMAKRGLISVTEIELAEIFEEIVQGAIQNALVKTFDESREVLEGITETVLRTFISVFPLAIIGGGTNTVVTYRQMTKEQKGQVETAQAKLEDAGLPPEQAEMVAVTEFAETEEGQVVIDKAVEEVTKPPVPEEVPAVPEAPLTEALIAEGGEIVTRAEAIAPTNASVIEFRRLVERAKVATTPEAQRQALVQMEALEDEVRAIAKVPKPPVVEEVKAPPVIEEVKLIETEVERQLGELSKMHDYWAGKIKTYEQTKASLAKYVRENLPTNIRGKFISAVAGVKTDLQLQRQMVRVQEVAEQNAQRVLRTEIGKEIKRTQAKVKQHILTGKFTAETQRRLDTIRHNLELPRAQAEDRIVSNFDKYDKGEITWEEMNENNEALNFVGIKEMTAKELMDTLDYIKVLKEVGRSERQAKRDAYRERMNAVRQDAVDTASGGKGSAKGIYSIPKSEWQATQSFLDKVINWMYNWDSILDKISKFRRDIPFKSPISIFGARVHRARHTQHLLQQEAQTSAIKGLEDIYKTKSRHQLNRILNSWKHEIITLGEFELAMIEGEEVIVKTIRMTKGQMMTMYNLLKDPTLDTTFRNTLRWTDEIMNAVRNNLTAEEKAYADWAMDFMKNDPHIGYDAINAVYSDIYGVDLPNNPFYFPAFRDMESEIQEAILTFREGRAYASVLNGSLKVRVRTIRALKFSDITDVISSHITKQAHFIAWGHTMRDMRAVFGNREVRETIEQYHGEHIMGEITKNLNDMARDGVERQQFGFIADYLRGNFTRAILGVKPSLLLKQIPSVFAYMTEMPMGDFITGVSNYWQNPVENYRFMLQRSPYLRERFGVGFERDVHFANVKKPADFLSGHKPIKGYITENIRFGDKFAVMQGMWATMVSELKALGVTVKTATEAQIAEAIQFAEDVTNRTQPAFDIETLAPLQRGGPWVKLLTMFQTQPGQYFRIIGNNFRNFQHHRGTRTNAIKNILLVWIVLPCLWQLIADGFQWKPEHQYRAMILGQLNWILIVSQMARSAYDWAVGEPYDYMASPVLASVRDFLFGIGKVRKLVLQGKDPYVDISMDDVISAVEFFGKAIGQVTGYPTPYLVQTIRGLRHYQQELKEAGEDPEAIEVIKRFLFSEWALEPPKQDVKDKAQEVSDKLGELIKEIDEVRIEYGVPGEYYGMKVAGSKFKSMFAHTLLSDITEENGFDKLAVAWAEMEIARQSYTDLLPNVPLWKINTDPMEGFTIIKLHQLWEARSRLTRLPDIVEFDKTWSDIPIHHGNVTRQQLNLLVKYLEAEDKDAFLESHPGLKVNPRNEWLKANPLDNAKLALWGQAKILTLGAYNEFNKLVKELDIPGDAIPEFTLPPEGSIDTHFAYEEFVSEGKHASWEAQLLLAKDPEYCSWHDLDLPKAPIASLELKVKNRELFDKYDAYGDERSPLYIEDDEARDKARDALKEANPEWVDDMRRIEAYENDGADFVEGWVDRGKETDEFGAGSSEAMVWLLDNPDTYDWAIANDLLEDRKDELLEREPILRINVEWATQDAEYNAIDGDDREARDAYLEAHPEYAVARRKRDAYSMDFPGAEIENYVAYYELDAKGFRQERMLLENPDFAEAMHTIAGIDLPDPKKVPAVQYDDIYDQFKVDFDKLEGLRNHKSPYYIEDVDERNRARLAMRFDAKGNLTEFGIAEIRRKGYGLFVPEKHIERYVGFYSIKKPDNWEDTTNQDRWYQDDWFLMEHPNFYEEIYIGLLGNEPLDFSKVPTKKVFARWLVYNTFTTQYDRDAYRLENPDLDEWGVSVEIWKTTMSEKRRRLSITERERFLEDIAEREEEFQEMLESLGLGLR